MRKSRLCRLKSLPSRGGAGQSEAEGLIYDFVCKTPQSPSAPAPLSGEPSISISCCLSHLRCQLPFQGSLLDGLQVAPQSASPPAPLSGEPSISISCCLRRLRRQLPFQGSRLYRSVVASGGFAASSPFRGAVYIDQLLPQAALPSQKPPLQGRWHEVPEG